MITVDKVVVRHGRRLALDGVSLSSTTGVCALLGPNGAGKTTLMSAVMGLKQFEGSITVAGEIVSAGGLASTRSSRNVGYLPQRFDLAGGLRVLDTVAYAAWVHGRPRRACGSLAAVALDRAGLSGKARHRVRTLSGGERQRLGIACATAHQPKILLLDEPTVGLDPAQRTRLRQYLDELAATATVILATHLLDDVRLIADHVVVINRGSTLFAGTVAELAALGAGYDADRESALECGYRRLVSVPDDDR